MGDVCNTSQAYRMKVYENRVLRRIIGPKKGKCGENCILNSFIIYTFHQILSGSLNHGGGSGRHMQCAWEMYTLDSVRKTCKKCKRSQNGYWCDGMSFIILRSKLQLFVSRAASESKYLEVRLCKTSRAVPGYICFRNFIPDWLFHLDRWLVEWFVNEPFLGPFAKLRKATISFVMSVRPSVRMEQLGSHWTNFHEICYFGIFQKSVEKIQVSLKSDKNSGYFTWRPIYVFDHFSPSSSQN